MRKKNNNIDLEYEKPVVKFIEQYRMNVNGGANKGEYLITDKISKKVKRDNDDEPLVIGDEEEDDYDVQNALVVDGNGNDNNGDFDLKKFKPEYVGSKKQKTIDSSKPQIKTEIKKQEENAEKQKQEEQLKLQFSKQQVTKPQIAKKSKLEDIVKRSNKPTILSFDQDDY